MYRILVGRGAVSPVVKSSDKSHQHLWKACPACIDVLSEAVELYRADFLEGFTLPDSPEFDEWQFFETEDLRRGRERAGAISKSVQHALRIPTGD